MKHRLIISTLTVSLLFLCITQLGRVSAAPGDLDTTFAGTGKSRIGFSSGDDAANAAAAQADGKLVVVGSSVNGAGRDFLVVRYNTDGSLDSSFDGDGKAITPVSFGDDIANAVAIQPDGKIVVAGHSAGNGTNDDFAVVRYNADGSLDLFFGIDGKVTTPITTSRDEGRAVALQADGKIVVAGHSFTDNIDGDFALVRYNPNGSVDTSFGNGGKVISRVSTTGHDSACGVAIQSDGKIVAVGYGQTIATTFLVIARYDTGGSLDRSFFVNGIGTYRAGNSERGHAVAIQPDGKIVTAGVADDKFLVRRFTTGGLFDNSFNGTGIVATPIGTGSAEARAVMITGVFFQKIVVAGYSRNGLNNDFAVARYNLDGSLDASFGGTGKVVTPIEEGADEASAVAMQAGLIAVAGTSFNGSNSDLAVVRYNPNGSLDNSFDGDGIRTDDVGIRNAEARGVAVQPDGKVVVAGFSDTDSNGYDFAVARYNLDGSLDTFFGGDGRATTDFNSPRDQGNAVAIQPDGKIVVAGSRLDASANSDDFALARYNPDGSPDASFNGNGRVITPVGPNNDVGRAVAIQPDGKIVVSGSAQVGTGNNDFAVMRYNPDGSPDTSFGSGGKVITPIGIGNDEASSVRIQPDGKIVVAGQSHNGSDLDFAVVRYNANGSIDTSFGLFGKQTTPIGMNSEDICHGMALQTDGKIVVAGYSHAGTSVEFAIVRYNPNGSPDTSFDGDGIVTTPFSILGALGTSTVIQPDGRILVAGTAAIDSDLDFAIARYNPDGSLDNSYGTGGKMVVDISGFRDIAWAIALDSAGRVVVAGDANGLVGVARLSGDICVSLASTSQSFASGGGSNSISVSAASCDWTATTNAPWISITSGSGSGDGAVNYTVAPNTAHSPRSGIITVAGQTFTVLQGAAFIDVPPTHPFYTAIGKLSAGGITQGCAQATFCPDLTVTRGQMAVFIIRARGEFNPPAPTTQRFADVPPTHPFYRFIDRMAALGITLGCGGGNYCPDEPVNRDQMAAFIIRGLGETNPPQPPQQRFQDVGPDSPFYRFIDRMAARGITQGCLQQPPLYCPTTQVSRGQMAAFLVRAFNL